MFIFTSDWDVTVIRKIVEEVAVTSRYLNIDRLVNIMIFYHFDDHSVIKVVVKAYVLDLRN
ncbi:hypothetical protein [uncultured Polaribacter sp.]|uniref:hypothetical protein n=1 Tax=uncultured Polaribacter sp. TaxID=174711 RepID=UPI0026327591|nr:hypothetical protein [uncultured Polaribacter sp.]